jgi:hypothetical protein
MPPQKDIQELKDMIEKLQTQLNELSSQFYRNNFTSSQAFNKDVTFNSRLRVPVYSSAPAICEVGDLIAVAGKLYICTVANTTFTLVGTQS